MIHFNYINRKSIRVNASLISRIIQPIIVIKETNPDRNENIANIFEKHVFTYSKYPRHKLDIEYKQKKKIPIKRYKSKKKLIDNL